jgi:hypothetical protein
VSIFLLSPTPVTDLSPCRRRWKVLREVESARRYCGTAVSFLSFCLKAISLPNDKVPTRFTNGQRTVLEEYKKHLTTRPASSNDDVENFQSALFCVLFREQYFEIEMVGRLACPVQSYIALLSLRKTGSFVQPGLVTQPISRLLYLSRGAVLKAALLIPHDDQGFTL